MRQPGRSERLAPRPEMPSDRAYRRIARMAPLPDRLGLVSETERASELRLEVTLPRRPTPLLRPVQQRGDDPLARPGSRRHCVGHRWRTRRRSTTPSPNTHAQRHRHIRRRPERSGSRLDTSQPASARHVPSDPPTRLASPPTTTAGHRPPDVPSNDLQLRCAQPCTQLHSVHDRPRSGDRLRLREASQQATRRRPGY